MAWKQQELYWTYKTGPIPTVEEALALGAVALGTTEDEWCKLSPGMRREIVRSAKRAKALAELAELDADDL